MISEGVRSFACWLISVTPDQRQRDPRPPRVSQGVTDRKVTHLQVADLRTPARNTSVTAADTCSTGCFALSVVLPPVETERLYSCIMLFSDFPQFLVISDARPLHKINITLYLAWSVEFSLIATNIDLPSMNVRMLCYIIHNYSSYISFYSHIYIYVVLLYLIHHNVTQHLSSLFHSSITF